MSNTPKSTSDADLWDSFTQYAQRCTICYGWLIGDTELISDPNHKYQIVHKSCVYISSDDDEPPVEPPVKPPVEPPVKPPFEPPVEPPVEPEPVRRLSRIRLSSATKRTLEKKKKFVKTNVLSI